MKPKWKKKIMMLAAVFMIGECGLIPNLIPQHASAAGSQVGVLPVLSSVKAGYVGVGESITAVSSQDGSLYLVPEKEGSSQQTIGEIKQMVNQGSGRQVSVKSKVPASIDTKGMKTDVYVLYAEAQNRQLSKPSAKIFLENTDPSPNLSHFGIRLHPGENGASELLVTVGIENAEAMGIGGYKAKDLTLEISENGSEYQEYNMSDPERFSQFTTSWHESEKGFYPGGGYQAIYRTQNPKAAVTFRNLKAEGKLLDTSVLTETAKVVGVLPSADKTNYYFAPNAFGLGKSQFLIEAKDADDYGVTGLKPDDFEAILNGKRVKFSSASFKNFKSDHDRYEISIVTGAEKEAKVEAIFVKGVRITNISKMARPVAKGESTAIDFVLFDSSSFSAPGKSLDWISLYVVNDKNDGIPGLSASDFYIKLDDGSKLTMNSASFTGFVEYGRGTYGVYFKGSAADTLYKPKEFGVKNYKTAHADTLHTAKPAPTRKLYIAAEY